MTESIVYATSNGTAVADPVEIKPKRVEFLLSADRLDDIKVKTWRGVESGSISGMADLVAMFAWNGSRYLSAKESLAVVDEMTTSELKDTAASILEEFNNTVASPK